MHSRGQIADAGKRSEGVKCLQSGCEELRKLLVKEVLLSFVERDAAGPVEHMDAKHYTLRIYCAKQHC